MANTTLIIGALVIVILIAATFVLVIQKTPQLMPQNTALITKSQALELFPYTKFSYNTTNTLDVAGVNYTLTGKLLNASSGASVFISNESGNIDLYLAEIVINSANASNAYNFFNTSGGSDTSAILLATNESQGVKYSLYSNNDANFSDPRNTYSIMAWKNNTFAYAVGRASIGYGTPGWNLTKLNATLLIKIVVSDLAQK